MTHLKIRISGRVQGVFFRAATKEKAVALGLKGVVRNEPDGTVYVEAEGEQTDLQPFLDWLKKGPPGARVENLTTTDSVPQNYRDFQVQH